MTTADNSQLLSLETVRTVWAIEIKDIDARLIGGQDPNARLNKAEETYVNIERKTGIEKSTQNMLLAGIGNLTGTTGLIMAGIALAGGLDLLDSHKTLKNAETTEKLLALANRPISSVDWDTLVSLIENIESWLIPILSKRIESLSEILLINSNDLAKERLNTYIKAIEELEVALATLKGKEKEFEESWASELIIYNKDVQELLEAYSTEKHRLALANEALLIDKAEFIARSREIEDKYASIKCEKFGCQNVVASGSHYCFHHKCFSPTGCANPVINDLHYCKDHVRNLADVQLELPSINSNPNNATKDPKKEDTSRGKIMGVLAALFVAFMIFAGQFGENKSPSGSAPQPAPAITPAQQAQYDKEKAAKEALIHEYTSVENGVYIYQNYKNKDFISRVRYLGKANDTDTLRSVQYSSPLTQGQQVKVDCNNPCGIILVSKNGQVAVYEMGTSQFTDEMSHVFKDVWADKLVPISVSTPALGVPPPNQVNELKSEMMDKFHALHNAKSFAEWGNEDMIMAVNLLSHPQTDADRKALTDEENFALNQECSTGSCNILQQEFAAAKKVREGKAKTAQEALGISRKPVGAPVQQEQSPPPLPPPPQQAISPSQAIDSMINAARIDNMAGVITAKEMLGNPTIPERGNRKVARLKNKDGLTALNTGDYKAAIRLFAEGAAIDQGDIELINNLGYAMMMDGQLDAAKAKLVDSLALDITRSGAWANLGGVYAKMGVQGNAVAAFKISYYFSKSPEKTIEFFKKLSGTDGDERIRNAATKAITLFPYIQPLITQSPAPPAQ